MAGQTKVNSNHLPTPAVPRIPPAKLPAAISHARKLLEDHLAKRPPAQDILARTSWAQDKDVLENSLRLLLAQEKIGWTEVPVPEEEPPQPAIPPATAEPDATPPPIPEKENPMPIVAKPAPDQLQRQVDHFKSQLLKVSEATTRPDFIRLRQAAYWMRSEILKFAKRHKLEVPTLPEMPKDTFGERYGAAAELSPAPAPAGNVAAAPQKIALTPEIHHRACDFLADHLISLAHQIGNTRSGNDKMRAANGLPGNPAMVVQETSAQMALWLGREIALGKLNPGLVQPVIQP